VAFVLMVFARGYHPWNRSVMVAAASRA
jgi:hypothetical protein